MNMNLSIFDDDDKRMTEIDDRCKDYHRLGSFFKPWYWNIQEDFEYTVINHIDIDALENIYDNIQWIHYDNFVSDNGINSIDIRNWFSHYLSHIILNEYIVSDEAFEYLKGGYLPKNSVYSVKLEETNKKITELLREYSDDQVKDELTTHLYITKSDYNNRLVLNFNIRHPKYDPISIKFTCLNWK